jgi:predicted  nucleic acid-binding Zn-ribbon protein
MNSNTEIGKIMARVAELDQKINDLSLKLKFNLTSSSKIESVQKEMHAFEAERKDLVDKLKTLQED